MNNNVEKGSPHTHTMMNFAKHYPQHLQGQSFGPRWKAPVSPSNGRLVGGSFTAKLF